MFGSVNKATSQILWIKAASRLQRRVNFAWWYQELTVPLVGVALFAGAFALVSRRYEWTVELWHWLVLSLLLVAAGGWAWFRSKKHRMSHDSALVWLEANLGLNNALSTAKAGKCAWPPFIENHSSLPWRWGQLVLPLLGGLAFFLLGAFAPIEPIKREVIQNQPYTWTRLEAEVEELVEEQIIAEAYAEKLKERIEELREQEASEWFSAASLEATDSLQQAHSREMNRLQRHMMGVQQAIKKMGDSGLVEAKRQKLQQQFEEAVEGMRNGQMKPNEELMKKLAEAAKEGMKGMSREQREELQKQMQELAKKMQQGQGGNPENGEPGEGDGQGQGELSDSEDRGEGPGKGDPLRGPGKGGDLFGADSPMFDLEKFERFEGKDDQEPDPGDLLNLEEIEHDLDETKVGPRTSGSAKNQGSGGDRVWKDALDPDEQKSLKSFFE